MDFPSLSPQAGLPTPAFKWAVCFQPRVQGEGGRETCHIQVYKQEKLDLFSILTSCPRKTWERVWFQGLC